MKGKEVSKERKAQIEKEKAKLRAELENVSVSDIVDNATKEQYGDRHYAREFNKIYVGVRKGLVMLRKKKAVGLLTNEEIYNKSKELLNAFLE